MDAIQEKIESCESTGEKASPPPTIILRAQMKITKQNGGFRTGYD